jgi:elongation factor Ts
MNDLILNIKNLREITGSGYLDCKKALEDNNNSIENAIDFLRKKGLAKATKKSTRAAKEGAIGIYSNEILTSIIQINTETDFAAKNDIFLNFMDEIGNFSLEANNKNLTLDQFLNMLFDKRSINDRFKDIIAKIGENIILSKLIIVDKNNDSIIVKYVHNSYRKNIGKIVAMIKLRVDHDNDDARRFGKNLCMHIAASKPLAMNIDQLDKKLIDKEKKVQLETIKTSGKPDNIIEKILDGKMNKFYTDSVLLKQHYILEPEKSVEQVVSDFSLKNKLNIINYELVILGS